MTQQATAEVAPRDRPGKRPGCHRRFSGTLSRTPIVGTSIIGGINGAIEALGRSLAVELVPIRVNVIAPGLIQGTDAYFAMPAAEREAMIKAVAACLPAGFQDRWRAKGGATAEAVAPESLARKSGAGEFVG